MGTHPAEPFRLTSQWLPRLANCSQNKTVACYATWMPEHKRYKAISTQSAFMGDGHEVTVAISRHDLRWYRRSWQRRMEVKPVTSQIIRRWRSSAVTTLHSSRINFVSIQTNGAIRSKTSFVKSCKCIATCAIGFARTARTLPLLMSAFHVPVLVFGNGSSNEQSGIYLMIQIARMTTMLEIAVARLHHLIQTH